MSDYMNNRKRLEDAQIISRDATLSPEQEKAIEDLTDEEIELLISTKQKLSDNFPPEDLAAPITHHH
jgi:hypothetical protein